MKNLLLLFLLLTGFSTLAGTIKVTNGNDEGPGSLRQAISQAHDGDSIVFTNASGSSSSSKQTIIVNTATTASITGNASFCAGGGTLLNSNATAGGGTISSYQWQESGNNILGATNATYTATAAGSYTVVVTNSGGFSTTSTAFAVTVNAVPTASVSGNASFCAGGNTLLSSNVTAGSGTISSYQWIRSLPGGDNNINGETNATYTASAGGLYEVEVTNSNGCSTQSIPFTVTVNALPTASISGNASFYAGGNTVLSSNATAGSGTNIVYQWELGGNNILGATNATYTATAAGSYTVVVTNSHACSTTSTAFAVTVNTATTASITGNASFCAGGGTLLNSNATAGGGTISSYQWQESGNNILGATNATYTAFGAGNYTVVVTNSGGFSTTSTAFAVTVNANPTASVTGNASFCAGGNTLLSSNATAGSGTISSIVWKSNLGIAGEFNATYTASIADIYDVEVTNSNGCSTQSNPFTVTVNAVPTASISGNASFYAGGNTVLSSNATAGSGTNIVYQWELGGNNILGATNATYTATAAGSYTVVVTNSNGCSTTSTAFAVTVNTAPTASITGIASVCALHGSTLLSSNATAGSGTINSYQWQKGGNTISGATNVSYTATTAGNYTVVVTNSGGFSTTSTAFAVTVNANPTASVTGNASFCAGGNTLLSSNATAGSGTISSIVWKSNLGIAGEFNATYTASIADIYDVEVTNSNGCSTQSNPFTVTVNAVPTASISGNAIFCAGGNTVLNSNATAGSGTINSYQWQKGGNTISGATNVSYTATTAGSYTVVVTNSNGCSFTSAALAVTVNALTVISSSPVSQTINALNNAIFSVTATGTSPITYQWQQSTDGGLSFNNLSDAGVYSGTATNTLNLAIVPISMTGYQYRCMVTGLCGTAT